MPRPRLAESLVWVAVLGLLAVAAVVQVGASRQRRSVSVMREELMRFAVAQESYLYDAGIYAPDITALEVRGFALGTGVGVEVREATADGWAAVATHEDTPRRCYLYVRTAGRVGGATQDGSLECD
jgi:type II secretory pathway pseudopilin PulG